MEILYSDKEIVVCVKPVGLDSEQQLPALLQEQLGYMQKYLSILELRAEIEAFSLEEPIVKDGKQIGGIGVSGGSVAEDSAVAQAGLDVL